ncbi:MAG TPA: DUF6296 family protein [Yinghuangia sp.]|uniref:DUF6296 family protein n=1 Tax=Yinghuangia sp. YIM S10712 TaxID=3436930 RepID=UPI002BE35173|nr:DUF6296 family protein [Yinghuangia sp.]
MTEPARYAITLPGCHGPHTPATVVIVHRTEARGPGRFPVYVDDTGLFRVQIVGGVAQPLVGTDSHGQRCLHALPLPPCASRQPSHMGPLAAL